MSSAESGDPAQPMPNSALYDGQLYEWLSQQSDMGHLVGLADLPEQPYNGEDQALSSSVEPLFTQTNSCETIACEEPATLPATLQYPSTATWGPFQPIPAPDQQPATWPELNYVQEPHLTNQFHCTLSEEELLHIKARRQHTGSNQDITTLFPVDGMRHMAGQYNGTNPNIYPYADDTSNVHYIEYRNKSLPYTSPALTDGSYMHGITLLTSHTVSNTPFVNESAHDQILSIANSPNDDRGVLSGSNPLTQFQRPAGKPVPSQPTDLIVNLSSFDTYDAQFESNYNIGSLETKVTSVSIIQSEQSNPNMSTSSQQTYSLEAFDRLSINNLNTMQPDLFSSLKTVQSKPLQPDGSSSLLPSLSSQIGTSVARVSRKRARTPVVDARKSFVPYEDTDTLGEHKGELRIQEYKNPDADREFKKTQKRTRVVTQKAKHACFRCFLLQKGCRQSGGSYCDGCGDFLRRFSHLTAIPKFTCDVRTKLSDLMSEIYFEIVGKSPQIPMVRRMGMAPFSLQVMREIYDVIEPQHIRRAWKDDDHMLFFLSYGSSVVRWRKAIFCRQPFFQMHLPGVEFLYLVFLKYTLSVIDEKIVYKSRLWAARLLNIIYEAVYSLKSRPMTKDSPSNGPSRNSSMVDHYLGALELRIMNLYLIILPTGNSIKKKERNQYRLRARQLASFPRTSGLMPQEYQDCLSFVDDRAVLQMQKLQMGSIVGDSILSSEKISEPAKPTFPFLSQYVAPGFLSIFGFNDRFFDVWKPDLPDSSFSMLTNIEERLKGGGVYHEDGMFPLYLALSPHASSLVIKAALESLTDQTCQVDHITLMTFVVAASVKLCDSFLWSLPVVYDAFMAWFNTWPHLSAALYAWAEDTQYVESFRNTFASFVERPDDDDALHELLVMLFRKHQD